VCVGGRVKACRRGGGRFPERKAEGCVEEKVKGVNKEKLKVCGRVSGRFAEGEEQGVQARK